jgi:NADH-quinone oxidoreductase subunit H
MPEWLITILTSKLTWSIAALMIGFVFTLGGIPFYTWLERRGAAMIQMRPGPNRRGPYGLVQAVADAVKLITKEDVVPAAASKGLHLMAPIIFLMVSLTTYAVIPWSLDFTIMGETFRVQVADLDYGILFMLAVSSLGVHALALAGWASHNKYSLLGAMRAAAQLISYEIAMGLALIAVFIIFGSVRLHDIVLAQSGPIWNWGVIKAPVAFLIFLVASYAETNRTPFDIVEADSEIVAGYLTEYSGLRFGMFYMGEYINLIVSAVVTSTLFFGGPTLPWAEAIMGTDPYARLFPVLMLLTAIGALFLALDSMRTKRRLFTKGNHIFAGLMLLVATASSAVAGFFWTAPVASEFPVLFSLSGVVTQIAILSIKMLFFYWLFVWVRWTLPRFRYDQLMHLGWKVFLPLGFANIGVTSILVVLGYL